ncbi:conserved hypothetical protein [Methanocella arvoryzae MRE50]|uniref:Methanogenesis regulatory protein FilR1 middle domain-containing protein n=2 Tax=Methanocella TaxID=570266 RepID=Q0W6R7_METAR|nr:conserved hypothetical protein [Methanocella arvoryzae MRE50]
MKSDGLLKSTMLSDIRKGILYILAERPMSLAEIRTHFDVTSASIIPRIKDLVKADLISKDDGKYVLTTTGTILVKKLEAMDDLEKVIVNTGEFLNTHDLSPIPARLIDRIDELGDCKVIRNTMEHITAAHDQIYDNLPKAKKIMGIAPVLDPQYPKIYVGLASMKIPVSIIIPENIYKKVEKEYSVFLHEFLSRENTKMYVIDSVRLVLVTTDNFTSIYLYNKNGTFDSMSSLFSSDLSATKWGAELFDSYLQKAREIKIK